MDRHPGLEVGAYELVKRESTALSYTTTAALP